METELTSTCKGPPGTGNTSQMPGRRTLATTMAIITPAQAGTSQLCQREIHRTPRAPVETMDSVIQNAVSKRLKGPLMPDSDTEAIERNIAGRWRWGSATPPATVAASAATSDAEAGT